MTTQKIMINSYCAIIISAREAAVSSPVGATSQRIIEGRLEKVITEVSK